MEISEGGGLEKLPETESKVRSLEKQLENANTRINIVSLKLEAMLAFLSENMGLDREALVLYMKKISAFSDKRDSMTGYCSTLSDVLEIAKQWNREQIEAPSIMMLFWLDDLPIDQFLDRTKRSEADVTQDVVSLLDVLEKEAIPVTDVKKEALIERLDAFYK